MIKFWKLKYYEDMNIFQRFLYRYRLAKQLKKQCQFTVMMDSLLDCRSEKGFNEILKEFF